MPTAHINGTDLHYELMGDQGPPVLLVMGMRSRGLAWEPVAEQLARDHRVVWFDHRGIGESAPLAGPTSMAEMAADGAGLMAHLGWESAHVAGVSMGGMVAQHLALHHRSKLRSLSLVATTSSGPSVLRPPMSTAWTLVRTRVGSPQQRLRALAELLYSETHRRQRGAGDLHAGLVRAFGHEHPGTWRAQYNAMAGHDVGDQLEQLLGLPLLVIGANGDRMVPVHHAEDLHRRLPGSQFLRFDSGHGVIAEHPAAVAEAMRQLATRADLEASGAA